MAVLGHQHEEQELPDEDGVSITPLGPPVACRVATCALVCTCGGRANYVSCRLQTKNRLLTRPL